MKLSELLTPREMEHARLASEGYSNWAIAGLCGCSEKYIANKMSLIYRKLGIRKPDGGSNRDPRIMLAVRYDREFGEPRS